jgi:Xaa-Pro dipeptidase
VYSSLKIKPITTKPTGEELGSRIDAVRSLMEKEKLDYYVCANTENVYYLTNFAYTPFERPFFLIIPASRNLLMIVPGLEISHAMDRVLVDVEYHTYYEYPAPQGSTYVDTLRKLTPSESVVGIESSISMALKEILPGKLKVTDIVDSVRMVKSEYEIGRIAQASSIAETGLKAVLELSQPGTKESAVNSAGSRQMRARVVREIPNPNPLVTRAGSTVWPKNLSAQPHSIPSIHDSLEEGGPNVVIITIQADGYSAELERTYFIKSVPPAARDPFNAMMEARALAFRLVKPGIPAASVDEEVLNAIKKLGYGDYILHRTGHGFGITGHEPPWVALGSETVLKKNMVISIEPGIYIPGLGGFRHSDTVLVTENGCVSLTNWPDTLEDLTLS